MHPISEQALALHRRAIVCDGHCDTILALDRQKRSLGERSTVGHADLPRLLEGGVTAQLFALFIEDPYLPGEAIRRTLQLLDLFYRELEANADRMLLATTAADIRRAKAEGKLAAVLGIEGGEAIEGDLAALRCFHRLGVRLLTVTWNRRNALADGQMEARTNGGLTTRGVEAVQEMNRLGMIVDLSHLSSAGVRDVLAVSQKPVIASHSNARALRDHPRNLTDEQVRGIADGGGLVGVTLVPFFIAPEGKVSLDRLVDHVEHLLQVGGEDHVGLGTDYDGFGFHGPADQFQEMTDVSHLPRLTEALLRRGLGERVIEKVLGKNFLRVLADVVGS
jgi:membrane dipeptidase